MFEFLFKYPQELMQRSELVYRHDWPEWVLWLLVSMAVVLVAVSLWRFAGGRWLQRAAIAALQIAMLAVVVWALLQPNLATDQLRDGENSVAMVIDVSESMRHGEGETRFDAATQSLANAFRGDDAPELAYRFYEMGATARRVSSFDPQLAGEAGSSFATALTTILEEARFSPLAGVVLASDGADTTGGLTSDELAAIASYGVPVHTIGVGRTNMPEDLELANIAVPARALPGSTVSARINIRHDRAGEANIKVYDGDELLALEPVELSADSGTTTAWIDLLLAEAGPHELSFTVDSDDVESERRNNTRATLVNVANQSHRVLYFEGEPRWEYKFMRRAVADDTDLGIATLLRVSPNKFYRQGIETPVELESGFPASRDELFGYDTLIIGSVEAALLTPEQQELVRDFVSIRGGSLLMIAGPNGLGNGGWGQSAIADVLPASLPPSNVDTFHRKKSAVVLTVQGEAAQMLRFAADGEQNSDEWQTLPEIADYQVIGNLKPAAETLLEADTDVGRIPLLVRQPYGRGNAAILATGGTWRWQMSLPVEDTRHETFWRQLLRAMVAGAPDSVSLEVSRTTGQDGIGFRAAFRDDAFRALPGVGVSLVATSESGDSLTMRLQPGDESGIYVGSFVPPHAGTWYFEAIAERDGEPIETSRSSLLYESDQAEYFGFRANPGLLARLSAATGGQYFDAADLSGLPDLLRYSRAGITETEYRPIWDAPIVFLLLILLKGGEWLLRRRWQTI